MTFKIDPKLKEFATERQCEYIDSVNEIGNRKTARKFGVSIGTLGNSLKRLQLKAIRRNYSPEHGMIYVAPEGVRFAGDTTLIKNGETILQWVKRRPDEQAHLDAVTKAVEGLIESFPKATPSQAPTGIDKDIIPWIQIGDAHLGMLAHASEVGENFDLKIAKAELCGAIGLLIDELPPVERIVINDLGDFEHVENLSGTTEASGHILDVDTRLSRVIEVAVEVMIFTVEKALQKAQHVDVIVNQGNHSRSNDLWMTVLLRRLYAHTGRVHVLNNSSVFIAYRMGNTLVMTHHGDKCKPNRIVNVMTHDYRKDFGETEFHYIDMGHVHHAMVCKEHPSVVVESFNHLSSLDRYGHDGGWRNRKAMTVVYRSRKFGDVGRRVLPIQEVWAKVTGSKPTPKPVWTV